MNIIGNIGNIGALGPLLACSIFATWYRLRNTDKLSICLHHRESLALGPTHPSRIIFRS